MKRMRIIGLCLVAVFALSAVVAGTASAAKAKPKLILKIKGGAALTVGANVQFFSSNLKTVTSGGTLECSENTLYGKVTENESIKADKISVTEETSVGAEEYNGEKHLCHVSGALGPTKITSGKFPWPGEFTVKKTQVLKGSAKVEFTSVFPEAGGTTCHFEDAKITSKFNVGGPLIVTTTGAKFKPGSGSSKACPKLGTLGGTFEVTSEGQQVEAELT
ncbi:MAG: hypothetical protein ABSG95_02240 [Solirubrobacteraceae bacterium]|jgi:hypothetical protein